MTSMDLDSQVELYDSDFLKIERGPLAWANSRTGSLRNLDDFVNKLKDEFLKIGFFTYIELGREAECRCYPHHERLAECDRLQLIEDSPYRIMISITSRTELQAFDFERMQHEVRNDILGFGTGGTIPFDLSQLKGNGHKHSKHCGHG